MPRKPVVSRTIAVSCVTAMVANEGKMKIEKKEYTIFKKCKDEKSLVKACQETENNEEIKVLRIVEKKTRKMVCKQTMQHFINESEKTFLN